jgi:uncharacterized protein YkwD
MKKSTSIPSIAIYFLFLGTSYGCEKDRWEEERKFCVDEINRYRSENGKSTLSRSGSLEGYADEGARSDASTGTPHGHFIETGGGGIADAENEIPGWPIGWFGSVKEVIGEGIQAMMGEGPGGGHYENILGNHTQAGCGIYVTGDEAVWVVMDFK